MKALTEREYREIATALGDDPSWLHGTPISDVLTEAFGVKEVEQPENSVERTDNGGGRGLGTYGEPVFDTYWRGSVGYNSGSKIEVQDSSAAMYDAAWLRIEGTAHLRAEPQPCAGIPFGTAPADISAHLDVDKAQEIVDRLQTWIARVS